MFLKVRRTLQTPLTKKCKQFPTTFVFTIYRLEQRPIFFIFGENHSFSPFLLTKALGRKSTIFKDFQGFWDFQGFPRIFIEKKAKIIISETITQDPSCSLIISYHF